MRRLSATPRLRRVVAACAQCRECAAPAAAPELTFHKDFIVSQKDYCMLLLEEAHTKHRVPINIPPQLNPPTDEHKCVYCDALQQRMGDAAAAFQFAPLHGPPPRIAEMDAFAESQRRPALKPDVAPPKKKGAAGQQAQAPPASSDKKYYCSVCSKAFRLALSCEQHVDTKHPGENAKVMTRDGGDLPPAPSPPSGAAVTVEEPPAAVDTKKYPPLSAGPNPLKELMASLDFSSVQAAGSDEPAVLFNLPSEAEIDTLLLDTWDPVGAKVGGSEFKPCGSYLIGDTDPKEARTGTTLGNAAHIATAAVASAGSSGNQSAVTSGGFTSPFVTVANRSAAPPTAYATAKKERRFKCRECSKAFRLYDAAVNHYPQAHGKPCPPEVLAEFKALDNPGLGESIAKAEEEAQAVARKAAKGQADPDETLPDATVPAVDLAAHIRVPSNCVMLGTVREVQHGYIRADPVLQLLLEVTHDPTQAAPLNDQPSDKPAAAEGEAAAEPEAAKPETEAKAEPKAAAETELVTVRCFGEELTEVLKPQAREGASVLVHGLLRLNHHQDPATEHSHAYPFVQVVRPYGTVDIVDAAP